MAQAAPRLVARRAFGDQDRDNVLVAESLEVVAVAQDLAEAEAEAELFFLVVVGDAFDLGDEDRSVCFPGEVEVRLMGKPGTWLDPRVPQHGG